MNPHDRLIRDKGYFVGKFLPSPIAADIVGTVHAIGSGVQGYREGDVVFGQADIARNAQGTQEYTLLDARFMAKVSESISGDEAATMILNPLTMVIALFDQSTLDIPSPLSEMAANYDYSTVKIVIIGAGTNCGQFAIQLAKYAGFGTIIAVAGKTGEKELRRLGATHVIDRDLGHEDIESQVRAVVGDELLRVCDCFNHYDQTLGVRLLSNTKKGTFVPLTHSGRIDEGKIGKKAAGYEVRKFVCHPAKFPQLASTFWRKVPELIDSKALVPTEYTVIEGLDADKVNAALDAYAVGRKQVKPHVHI